MKYLIKVKMFDGTCLHYYYDSDDEMIEKVQEYLKDNNVYSVEVIKND